LALAYLCSLDKFSESIAYFKKCLVIDKEVGDLSSEASVYGSTGDALGALGRYEDSVQPHKQYIEVMGCINTASAHECLASAYHHQRKHAQRLQQLNIALEYVRRAHRIFLACFGEAHPRTTTMAQAFISAKAKGIEWQQVNGSRWMAAGQC
jgi:tetratricopeptide (TPR) repeat protein